MSRAVARGHEEEVVGALRIAFTIGNHKEE